MGHELAHAIDPCNGQFGVFKVSAETLRRLKASPDVTSDNEKYDAVTNLLSQIDGDSVTSWDLTAAHMRVDLQPRIQAYLEDQKAVTRLSADVPFERYPMRDVYQCLSSPAGGGFHKENAADIQAKVNDIIEDRQTKAIGPYDAKADAENMKRVFATEPECRVIDSSTHMGEVVADWFGAVAQTQFMKDNGLVKPVTTPRERIQILGVKAMYACYRKWIYTADRVSSPKKTVEAAWRDLGEIRDSHGSDVKRVEDVYLRDPVIRTAMGCEGTVRTCNHTTAGNSSGTAGAGLAEPSNRAKARK